MTTDDPARRGADDFTCLPRIGPVIAARLRGAGITRFEHLAARSPPELVEVLAGIRSVNERTVRRSDWVGRATRLARARRHSTGQDDTASRAIAYESFIIRLGVHSTGVVCSVRLQRVRDGEVRQVPDLAAACREIDASIDALYR